MSANDTERDAGAEHAPPLSHLRVIELGAFIAGPFCGQLLGDLGADVIKIEPPDGGDAMRQWGVHQREGKSLWWPVIARNKRSIVLDLRQPEGQEAARKLIGTADVVIENFRPGTLEAWNLDPAKLIEENPQLIVARVSGFGQSGPYKDKAGFAAVAEAVAGLRALTGYPDRPPTRVGISIGDSLAGLFAAFGVVAALQARDAQGKRIGQVVDVAISESVLAVLESVFSEYSATGELRRRSGTVLPKIAPSNIYQTADGTWMTIAANADGLFRRLSVAMGIPELAQNPRYASHRNRGENQEELDALIAKWAGGKTRAEIERLLDAAGVPAGPVNDASDVVNDPHFRAREAIVEIDTDDFGRLAMQGIVPKLLRTPGNIKWCGPELGQHSEQVSSEIGMKRGN